MAWSPPATWTAERLSAAKWNQEIVGNQSETAPAKANAKGDLFVADGPNSIAVLPVGTNDLVLTADSAETLGVKWGAHPTYDEMQWQPVSATNTGTLSNHTEITTLSGGWFGKSLEVNNETATSMWFVPTYANGLLEVLVVYYVAEAGNWDWQLTGYWGAVGETISANQTGTATGTVNHTAAGVYSLDVSTYYLNPGTGNPPAPGEIGGCRMAWLTGTSQNVLVQGIRYRLDVS